MAVGPQEQWGRVPHPRTGVTLTCRTSVLRVTRSMGLYSNAEGREEVSAAIHQQSPGPSPTRESQDHILQGQGWT